MPTPQQLKTRIKRVLDPNYMRLRDELATRLSQVKMARNMGFFRQDRTWDEGYNDALDGEIDYLKKLLEEYK